MNSPPPPPQKTQAGVPGGFCMLRLVLVFIVSSSVRSSFMSYASRVPQEELLNA